MQIIEDFILSKIESNSNIKITKFSIGLFQIQKDSF